MVRCFRCSPGTLEQLFSGNVQRRIRCEVVVECFEGGMEAVDLFLPRNGRRIVPTLLSFGDAEAPVQQIADVSENLGGSADNEALRNFFSSHTSVAEATLTLMVRTFKTMADLADFESTEKELPEVETNGFDEQEQEEEKDDKDRVVNRKMTQGDGMTVNINIQLQAFR